MTNKKSTKRSLLFSLLSLILCFSMLVGTTFAWFTDSVTSANNVIMAGNLDVDVYYGDVADKKSVQGVDSLFSSVKLWEPGALAYENLTVVNNGTLDLKYQMTINFANENFVDVDGEQQGLSDILCYALVDGGVDKTLTREELIASIPETDWNYLKDFVLDGEIEALTADETVGVVIWWAPTDYDNDFNVNNGKQTSDGADHLHIDLGIKLVATQLASEEDSFDENYDKDATFPVVAGGVLPENSDKDLVLKAGRVTVTVPKGSPAGDYKLEKTKFDVTETNDATNVDTDIHLTKDGAKVDPNAAMYFVEIKIDIMSMVNDVKHNGEDIVGSSYDPFTGILSFYTNSFSPFEIDYEVFGEEVKLGEGNKIISGYFKKVNPATLDASLLGDDSEYIAVDYVKDGVKHYAVSARATTVIIGDNDNGGSGYTFENENYTVKMVNNNSLYSIISGLQNNKHSTVYILPGTYNEDTAINVYSSMDIMGLGNAEDIKIIKVKGSYSNRHLFNCNGAVTREEHIQVTIRNLYLDANAKNLNSAGKLYITDNGAVQSIRMSKVKCYDLIIAKSSGFAFYVNGKYDTRGAYLYAENCTMTTNSVVDTASNYRFYYNDLTYGKGIYSDNTSYIKNYVLEWNDWDWVN